jgi:hypothetical protein
MWVVWQQPSAGTPASSKGHISGAVQYVAGTAVCSLSVFIIMIYVPGTWKAFGKLFSRAGADEYNEER